MSKKTLELYALTNELVEAYDKMYHYVDLAKMVELYVESKRRIMTVDLSVFTKEEHPVVLNLLFVLNRASDISTLLIGIHETMRQKHV